MRRSALALALLTCMSAPSASQQGDGYTARVWVQWCQSAEPDLALLCIGYLRGLAGYNDFMEMAKRPMWCPPRQGMTTDRMKAIILGDIIGKNRDLETPFAWLAIGAMFSAFPCKAGTDQPLPPRK